MIGVFKIQNKVRERLVQTEHRHFESSALQVVLGERHAAMPLVEPRTERKMVHFAFLLVLAPARGKDSPFRSRCDRSEQSSLTGESVSRS